MRTDKQKLEKLQAKLDKLDEQITEIRKTVNLAFETSKGFLMLPHCEYCFRYLQKVLLDIDKIMKE